MSIVTYSIVRSERDSSRADGLASSEEELLLLALFGEEAEALLRSIRERSGGEESLASGAVPRDKFAWMGAPEVVAPARVRVASC